MGTPVWRKARIREREAMKIKEIIEKNGKLLEKMRVDIVAIMREDRERNEVIGE